MSKQHNGNSFNVNGFDSEWINTRIDTDGIEFADKLGKYLCDLRDNNRPGFNAMTTNQIRNIFGEVKRIQRAGIENSESDFLLLRPKLAYAEARAISKSPRNKISAFREVIERAHKAVDLEKENTKEASFQRFVDFFEAVLAYHKAYGGRD